MSNNMTYFRTEFRCNPVDMRNGTSAGSHSSGTSRHFDSSYAAHTL